MKKNIIITGSTGFIGQNLTKFLLSLNYKVLVLIRKNQKINFLLKNSK